MITQISIKDALEFAIETDDSLTAHALFWGLSVKVFSENETYTPETINRMNFKEIEKMKTANLLNIEPIRLFAIPINKKDYAMYFAKSEGEAWALFNSKYQPGAKRLFDMTAAIDKSVYLPETGKHQTWRDIKKSIATFPAFAGEFARL